jgi:hypothetical protein
MSGAEVAFACMSIWLRLLHACALCVPVFVWAVFSCALQAKRRENLTKGLELMDAGKRLEAEQCFQKAISITPEMANQLQHALFDKGVQCIVAPYEAGLVISAVLHTQHRCAAHDSCRPVSDMRVLCSLLDCRLTCFSVRRSASLVSEDAVRPFLFWLNC